MPTVTRGVFIAILLAGFALPLYWPPAGAPLTVPTPETDLVGRLFPGIPSWWVIGRLACLGLAAALLPALPLPDPTRGATPTAQPQGRLLRIVLVIAAVLLVAGFFSTGFNRQLQLVYVAALFLPAAILVFDERKHCGGSPRTAARGLGGIFVVTLVWLIIRAAVVFHSPRSASAVDMTASFELLRRAAAPDFNVITGAAQAGGITALHLVPEGAGILGWSGLPVTIAAVQSLHLFWVSVTAIAIGLLARRLVGTAVAAVAVAAFLFSPYILATSYYVAAVYLGSLFGAVSLLLHLEVRDRCSSAAVALLAAVAGIAVTHPGLAPVPLCAFGLAILSTWRSTGPRYSLITLAILLFAAACLPALPAPHDLGTIFNSLAQSQTAWSALEASLFGQVATHLVEFGTLAGRVGPLDVLLSVLLTPFAIPRTAVRLLSDTIADPIATALATLGIATCTRWCWRDARARGLLALLALALLPAVVSSYDRPSLTRAFVLPVPLALLAALGCNQLQRLLAFDARLATALVTATIAASGLLVFDLVNPAVLPTSATSIALEALERASPQPRAPLILRHPLWDPEEVETYATLAAQPLPVLRFAADSSFARPGGTEPDLLIWSPGLEESSSVAQAICAHWPEAALYTLADKPGQSRVFAARPYGPDWTPGLPGDRWAVGNCESGVETEADGALQALNVARARIEAGQTEAAIEVLRAAARRSFVSVGLFDTLARLQLERATAAADLDDAWYWAWRATLPKSGLVEPWLTLAQIEAAQGHMQQAIVAATRALALAKQRNDDAMRLRVEALIGAYESRAAN